MAEKHLVRAIAVLACVSLIIQTGVDYAEDGPDAHLPTVLWNMARYYTILTNLTVAAIFGAVAYGKLALRPHGAGAITLQIMLVGIVYHALLAATHTPSGLWGEVANHGLHTVVPALVFIWWLGFAPKSGLTWRDPLGWVIWPLAYSGYALIRGMLDGKFPYYFLDLPKLGPIGLLREMSIVAAGFLVFGFILLRIARIQRPSESSR